MGELNKQNQEDVVIHNLNLITTKNICNKLIKTHPNIPFSKDTCDFLVHISKNIQDNPKSKKYPDLLTFSFYCRKGNLELIKKKYSDLTNRLGRGNIFHITPSNIAINFAYSFVFGILAGNNNIVRLPSKDYQQIEVFMSAFDKVVREKKFKKFKKKNIFVRYKKNKTITELLSNISDVRVLWGGDKTIDDLRLIKIPQKSTEIVFSDRYSFSIINTNAFSKLNLSELSMLAKKFYNDTYVVDQNACSSPHLVIWLGNNKVQNIEKFWKLLSEIVKKNYNLTFSHSFEKYNSLLNSLANYKNIRFHKNYSNYLYRVILNKITQDIVNFRGKYGIFFEYNCSDLKILEKIVTRKIQTLTYFGFKKEDLIDFIIKKKLNGIDRIVPIGTALNLELTWDGYDIIRYLSREIEIK